MNPLVSVIIPTYNGEAYLAESIQSILDQDYPQYEIWVIDNGSTDQTEQIARSFSKVQYHYSTQANTALARNMGISFSDGEYIAFLDQDDIWPSQKLSKQVDFLESQKQYGAVIGLQQMFLQQGHAKPHWLKQEFLEKPQLGYLPSTLMARRSTFSMLQNFNPSLSLASDVAWFFKAKQQGVEMGIIDEVLVYRRIHQDNASHQCVEAQKQILAAIKLSLTERRQA